MSRYGEPGVPYGAYPGQPREPYDPPSDPWGQGDGDLTAPQPPGGYPGHQAPPYDPAYDPAYDQPPRDGPYEVPHEGGPYGGPYETPYDRPYDRPYRPPHDGPPPYEVGGYPAPAHPGALAPAGMPPGPPPGWDPDPGPDLPPSGIPPERRGNVMLFVAVGLLVLVVAAAVGYALYLLSGEGTPSGSGTSPIPVASAPPATAATPEPTQGNIGLNAAMAREGDCLTNLGSDLEPQLQIVPCDGDGEGDQSGSVYQVLAKFDAAVEGDDRGAQDSSAQAICDGTAGYTHHYFEVSETLNFVLCMEETQAGA